MRTSVDSSKVKPDMPVICSDGMRCGTVDHLEGSDCIKLKKDENGQHHYIPTSWVESVEGGKVKVDRSEDEALQGWSTSPLHS
jgi:hypothetical protein